MVRLKFLLFALLALALGAAHLPLVSAPLSRGAVEGAQGQARSAASAAARALEARAALVELTAARLVADPEAAQLARRLSTAPTPERLTALRGLAERKAPAGLEKDGLVVGLAGETSAALNRGGAGAGGPSGVDALGISRAATGGTVREAFGALHLFFALPVPQGAQQDAEDTPREATLVVGVPLVPKGGVESLAPGAGAVALAEARGKVLASGGPDKALVAEARQRVKPGTGAQAFSYGALDALGPLALPLFTRDEGGEAPLAVGAREPLANLPYEAVAVVSLKPFMGALADYQRAALFTLLGMLVLAGLWSVFMHGEASAPSDAPDTLGLTAAAAAAHAQAPAYAGGPGGWAPPPVAEPYGLPPPVAQGHASGPYPFPTGGGQASGPYPFPTGGSGPYEPPPPMRSGTFDGMPARSGAYEPPPVRSGPYEQPAGGYHSGAFHAPPVQGGYEHAAAAPAYGGDYEEQPTQAYTLGQGGLDPYAMSAQQGLGEESTEATRVAAIPQELLQAAAAHAQASAEAERFAPPPPPPMPSVAPTVAPRVQPSGAFSFPPPPVAAPAGAADPDEAHFQDVYRAFLATREQCGEPADGLTYDKFAAKLRKNREQLVQKYACRTVRFQVYVKDGKAALKATPVKE